MLDIPNFTKIEIDFIKKNANFTHREMDLFCLRNDGYSHEECAKILHVCQSTEYRINRKMINKIIRII